MNLCEAFNRINRLFGANRMKITSSSSGLIQFELSNFGLFLITILGGDLVCLEWSEPDHQFLVDTNSAKWLTGVANGLTRDAEGNMVKPSGTASSAV